ncbi:hypothetical protein [Spirulina major]|uniref:hypothetical protein n=1 Tax=Spirulina major TaxID=270636 RepID=UPI00111492A2|nr:hypothetical protein [Spirulina major]
MKRSFFACLTTATLLTTVMIHPFVAQALPPLPAPPSGENAPSEDFSLDKIMTMMTEVEERLDLTDSQKSQFQMLGLDVLTESDLFSPAQLHSMVAAVQGGGSPFDALGGMDLSPSTIRQVGEQVIPYLARAQSIFTDEQKSELRAMVRERLGDPPFPPR